MSQPKLTAGRVKPLHDQFGVIRDAAKHLPTAELKLAFLDALAELQDNECHRTHVFPKTRLHKVAGSKYDVWRADIDKVSGWRLHVQYRKDGALHLIDLIEGRIHDRVIESILAKKDRYAN